LVKSCGIEALTFPAVNAEKAACGGHDQNARGQRLREPVRTKEENSHLSVTVFHWWR